MLTDRKIWLGLSFAGMMVAAIPAAYAQQQTTGTPGTPDATTTIDGRYLPPPPAPFGGTINLDSKDSKPYWPPTVVPPKGAPNVLLIMTDDQGYGVPAPLAVSSRRRPWTASRKPGYVTHSFTQLRCARPRRRRLITGRNHHSVGFGVIAEMSTGFPGYDSVIGPESATVGTILKQNGYATSWFGKNHNTPSYPNKCGGAL